MATKKKIPVPEGMKLIFRRYRKDPKSNQMLDARRYGCKAWPILVPAES
ncbi:hypothetical protein [Pseudoalteromonas phenolica]|nr:hypothetical protein [Pseudoalteromonas phenolica]